MPTQPPGAIKNRIFAFGIARRRAGPALDAGSKGDQMATTGQQQHQTVVDAVDQATDSRQSDARGVTTHW